MLGLINSFSFLIVPVYRAYTFLMLLKTKRVKVRILRAPSLLGNKGDTAT